MKRTFLVILALLLLPVMAMAEDAPDFSAKEFRVTGIDDRGAFVSLHVSGEAESEAYINLADEVLVVDGGNGSRLDVSDIKEGDSITAIIDNSRPMIMIYPPQYSPAAVIVHRDEYLLSFESYDNELLNESKTLQLNPTEDTVIINQNGSPVSGETLSGKQLAVIYKFTTKSIPAKTTPVTIISFSGDGTLVPLREAAESLGYNVSWNGELREVTLSRGGDIYKLTIGSKSYTSNDFSGTLETEARIIENRTYVTREFINLL